MIRKGGYFLRGSKVATRAYLPIFNPIEYMFGYVKKAFQRSYGEFSGRDLMPFVMQTFRKFESFNMAGVFEHCGWMVQGLFNPGPQVSKEKRLELTSVADTEKECRQDELEFS
ncbi:hypothetical protein JG687_00016587 [Phytophthora cactorum]|uniref:Uncharacterized protein n=1 Tax=Phytophthora cactorum TaxID=29920 RepID=A0A8T1TU44_9STRA|nr:hypothetical protein JG687_00016587 [Phytophthora cactorum]